MRQLILVAAMLLMLAGIAGCSTRYVNVRGERFEMISEKEEAALVEHARAALKTISKWRSVFYEI